MFRNIGSSFLAVLLAGSLYGMAVGTAAAITAERLVPTVGYDPGPGNGSPNPPPPLPPAPTGRDCEVKSNDLKTLQREISKINHVHADDAIQDALIAYLKECRKGTVFDKPLNWLRVTARNKLFNIKRKERTFLTYQQLALDSPSDELGMHTAKMAADLLGDYSKSAVSRENTTSMVSRDLFKASKMLSDRLTLEQLSALHGKYNESLTAAEIARQADVPLTTAQARIRAGDSALVNVIREVAPPPAYASTDYGSGPSIEAIIGCAFLLIALAIGIKLIAAVRRTACEAEQATTYRQAQEAAYRQYQDYAYLASRQQGTTRYLTAGH